jgi:protein-tyrosine phosphatase
MTAILFVCTANRFRSPLAAAFFKKQVEHLVRQSWDIDSAGTWAQESLPPMREAIQLARKYGVDIQKYRSKQVNEQLILGADLVLCMEMNQKEALQVEFSQYQKRIYCFSEAAENRLYDIPDFITKDGSFDITVGEEIHALVLSDYENIIQFARTISK